MSSSLPPPPATAALQRQLTGTADALLPSSPDGSTHMLPATVVPDIAALAGAGAAVVLDAAMPAPAPPANVYDFRLAGITDPGVPGKQNQDDFFLWESADGQTVVAGVFDGHGRQLGQLAASVARASVRDQLARADVQAGLRTNPQFVMERVFMTAHAAIESAFRSFYEEQGWSVTRAPEGYLIRNKGQASATMCVHGGSTATLLVILDGRRIIVSNVGDSTAIIAGLGDAGALHPVSEWTPLPPPIAPPPPAGSELPSLPIAVSPSHECAHATMCLPAAPVAAVPLVSTMPPAERCSSYMELSADHSPESHSEFQRMLHFRPHAAHPHVPELLFVYDTLSGSKMSCPPIFDVNSASGAVVKTDRGTYYKNVRCEWATLVATPPHAPFQDALAFTRSLGDLHLQSYGVSHVPETWWMDITQQRAPGSASEAPLLPHPLSIVLASDGVWDNWKFEEVAAFALEPTRVAGVLRTGSAASATSELMAANLQRGHANFGSSADNMTAIVMYMLPHAA